MRHRFLVALMVVAALVVYGPVASAASSPTATVEIQGAVMASDGMTAVEGAVVRAAHMETRTVYESAPTSTNGAYSLANLPAGSYDLAIETSDGIFISDAFLQPEPGKKMVVFFALQPADGSSKAEDEDDSEEEEGSGEQGEQGEEDPPPDPEPKQQTKKKKTGGFFKTPGGAALAIVLTGGLLGAAANSATKNETDLNIPSLTGS